MRRQREMADSTSTPSPNDNNNPATITTTQDKGDFWKKQPNRSLADVSANDLFVRFYREVNPLFTNPATSEASWSNFSTLLETPLRTSFWVNETDALAASVIRDISNIGGRFIEPITWFPQRGGGWRVTAEKTEFRRSPEIKHLRQLIVRLTDLGVISRQEEVSMIPPLLLQIGKNDRCLDMCAAPGSKTAQMLVALGRDCATPSAATPFDYTKARGLVVANELDEKRSNLLVHQCKRIRSLYPFAIFTNHDARYMPDFLPKETPNANEFFDKVLCDVMCSGDGTIRKAPNILRKWRPFDAANLQKSQIQVALRGAHLLRIGGRLVYSTCSMNPIENEAVVSQILLRTGGALRLVDPRTILPQLPSDPGMRSWNVMRNDGRIAEGPEPAPSPLHPALFPVPGADYPLELCLRMLPHHVEGGGFFVALFEKVAPFCIQSQQQQQQQEQTPAAAATTTDADDPLASGVAPEIVKQSSAPLLPFATPSKQFLNKECRDFFGIDPNSFPFENVVFRVPDQNDPRLRKPTATDGQNEQQQEEDELFSRTEGLLAKHTTLQLVSTSVRELLVSSRPPQLRISATGLRTFVPQPNLTVPCLRVAFEASSIVGPCMSLSSPRRFMDVSIPNTMEHLIRGGALKDVLFADLVDAQLKDRLESLSTGCILMCVNTTGNIMIKNTSTDASAAAAANNNNNIAAEQTTRVWIPALRARTRLQLLVDNEDLPGLALRLGVEPPEPLLSEKQLQQQQQQRISNEKRNQQQQQQGGDNDDE